MVVDDLTEETNSITSLSELNRHLESILPEVYLDDIYKYLRDCEVCVSTQSFETCAKFSVHRNVIDPNLITCVNSRISPQECEQS